MTVVVGCSFPEALHYLVDEQVWAQRLPDGTVRVGITALGIRLAGEIYMCRPKAVGSQLEQGRAVAIVELAKSIVAVKSPLSGTVVEINQRLADKPELVHLDPYGEGWLSRLQPADFDAEAQALVHGDTVAAAMQQHAWLHGLS